MLSVCFPTISTACEAAGVLAMLGVVGLAGAGEGPSSPGSRKLPARPGSRKPLGNAALPGTLYATAFTFASNLKLAHIFLCPGGEMCAYQVAGCRWGMIDKCEPPAFQCAA